MSDLEDPELGVPLKGGRTRGDVRRVGETVRRPTGFWTPGVHALLNHLEGQGYAAPRVLGIDSFGREILTYVAGDTVWPHNEHLVQAGDALTLIAANIRSFHDGTVSFDAESYTWSDRSKDPCAEPEVICHNDLAAWNLVLTKEPAWVFIDWDLAAPGRRSWDVAWALLTLAPFSPDSGLDAVTIGKRIRSFCSGYGMADICPDRIVYVALERAAEESRRIAVHGAAGTLPYSALLADGHGEMWSAWARHIERSANAWLEAAQLP